MEVLYCNFKCKYTVVFVVIQCFMDTKYSIQSPDFCLQEGCSFHKGASQGRKTNILLQCFLRNLIISKKGDDLHGLLSSATYRLPCERTIHTTDFMCRYMPSTQKPIELRYPQKITHSNIQYDAWLIVGWVSAFMSVLFLIQLDTSASQSGWPKNIVQCSTVVDSGKYCGIR